MNFRSPQPKQIQYLSIEPVPKDTHRPLWSVMVPTYNGTKYLEQTLRSVLDQALDPEQMQIEVVDDCSTEDGLETLVKELGQGRVSFYRNSQNVGLVNNWNVCIQRACGYWVHILHQDDVVFPGFYRSLEKGIQSKPSIGAAFCRHLRIDEDSHWKSLSNLEQKEAGVLEQWIEKLAICQRVEFPSMIVKRSTYEELGGFCPDVHYAADWEMWKRIAINYSVWFEPQVLACYRQHSASETSRLVKSGLDIVDTRKAIQLTEECLPSSIAHDLSNQAREHLALRTLGKAWWMFSEGELAASMTHIREALNCSSSFKTIFSLLSLFGAFGKHILLNGRLGTRVRGNN